MNGLFLSFLLKAVLMALLTAGVAVEEVEVEEVEVASMVAKALFGMSSVAST